MTYDSTNIRPFALSLLIVAAACAVAAGCSADAASPSAPTSSTPPAVTTADPGASTSTGGTTPVPVGSAADVTPALVDALTVAIQDEYHAQAVYERILADFGSVRPFSAIVGAERQHAASLAGLFQARGLAVPASAWNLDNVPRFSSVTAACAAAAQAERDNVAVYDAYPTAALPLDVARVFANNRWASLNNHLPAFLRCS